MGKQAKKRFVRIVAIDPDPSVPLERSIVVDTGENFVDSTNMDLISALNLLELIKPHNEYRATLRNEEIYHENGADVKLRPISIDDLRMLFYELNFGEWKSERRSAIADYRLLEYK